ncbi:hypothetical protein D3C84_869440 [compost metagenome]
MRASELKRESVAPAIGDRPPPAADLTPEFIAEAAERTAIPERSARTRPSTVKAEVFVVATNFRLGAVPETATVVRNDTFPNGIGFVGVAAGKSHGRNS